MAIGIISTPAPAAQEVADLMVAAGIRSILNFAPAVITVPPEVSLRKVDLSIELQILGFYEQRKAALADVKRGRAGRSPSSDRSADLCRSSRSACRIGGRRSSCSSG